MAVFSPLAGLAAPVSVAEIELDEPSTVTHCSVATPGKNGRAPHVQTPAGAVALGPFAYGISRLRNRLARYTDGTRHAKR